MQEINEEIRTAHIRKVIGKTTYVVTFHFGGTSRETLQDKIKRLILRDIQSGSY